MSDRRSTKELFAAWRGGDPAAGQKMAQRFADWYYAIATSRLGESRGRGPCDTACERFGRGVVDVTEGRALVKWAHGIIKDELSKAGGTATDGDEANAYTANQTPKALLVRAKAAMPAEVGLLELVYGGKASEEEITEKAEPLGGNPIGTLTARYRVKRWLRDNVGVPFSVAPDQPVLDRAPLPQYESTKMASNAEMEAFEEWMLTDIDLCRDIAEFATFSVALRGGLAGAKAAPLPTAAASNPAPSAPAPTKSSKPILASTTSRAFVVMVILGMLVIMLVTIAVVVVSLI